MGGGNLLTSYFYSNFASDLKIKPENPEAPDRYRSSGKESGARVAREWLIDCYNIASVRQGDCDGRYRSAKSTKQLLPPLSPLNAQS